MGIFDLCLILFLILLDFISKEFVARLLKNKMSVEVLRDILSFSYVENKGAAFGILKNKRFFFICVSFIAIILMVYYFFEIKKKNSEINKTGLIFIMAGTVGNFLDRIFRGYVIDFIEIEIINFPVFNLADIFLTVGIIWFGCEIIFKE